ncbi:MAG: 5-formyltetrahydrofolate cyclo-ligase [Hirschia sp.]|nr:5-formyltetrahydrofolate cyclo-ligase [Hirschia sp.]MBF19102.1 5-formyltetrahydrofolate cyclo-ligase [Hirschia sp.]MBF20236.1 5-formyltetrahydrofolate cyclo-ligase [Hirschia sp.]
MTRLTQSAEDHKQLLRSHMREIRAEADARDPDSAEKLAERFPAKLLERFGPVVAGYIAINDELDPAPLLARLKDMGAVIALPRIEADGAMTFRIHGTSDKLVSGPFNLQQPSSTAVPVQPSLVLAPLLAFDSRGTRLGYGKGHYDRAMADIRKDGRCFYVGLAHAAQQVDAVPSERHDIPLDWVETPDNSVPLFLARAARQEQN